MSKFVCTVCGYVYEGDAAPEFCPVCKAPASKFVEQKGEMTWAAEHVVGVAKGVDPEIIEGLRMNFNGQHEKESGNACRGRERRDCR